MSTRTVAALALGAALAASPALAADPLLFSLPAAGEDATPLTSAQAARLARLQNDPTAMGAAVVGVTPGALRSARLQLNLPGQAASVLSRKGAVSGDAWQGAAESADAVLVRGEEGITGTIRAGGKVFSLRAIGGGKHVLIERDLSKLPPDHPPGWQPPKVPQRAKAPKQSLNTPEISGDDAGVYRVLVAYTSKAATQAAGNILGVINLAIAETNAGYEASGVNTRIALAHAYQTPSPEPSSITTALYGLQRPSDGWADEAHSLRNTHAADVVILLGSYTGTCGVAYVYASATYAFGVVGQRCATGYYSFAHEIGHIFGARHNPEQDSSNTPLAYGHGKYYPTGHWRTIMAYDCPGGCTRINRWSNPRQTLNGVPLGDVTRRDNARVLNEQANRVANFRQTPIPAAADQ